MFVSHIVCHMVEHSYISILLRDCVDIYPTIWCGRVKIRERSARLSSSWS